MTSAATAAEFSPSTRQQEAISTGLGPVLVLAGPGAGKTFCLIERIRFLLEHHKLEPGRVCAVTFTNKAAQEIAERLGQTLGERAQAVKGGTLHALCAEVLREHGEWVGVRRGFGIADEEYQRDVLGKLGVWNRGRRGALLKSFTLHRVLQEPLTPDDAAIYQGYREHFERRGLLDFDDLVVRAAALLEQFPEVREQVAARWDYLLVDEFQDLNPCQYAVIRRLGERHGNVFAVGDDEQSVFSWTGARPQVLLDFVNDFRVAADRKFVLDENRRNARQIFEPARRLMERNPPLFDQKRLQATRESDHLVRVLGFADEQAEARWLLDDLKADRSATGLPWGEYGVLYRRHETGDALEAELLCDGIPCRLASGRALQDDRVVRYLVAALRVIAHPDDPLRKEAFARVVLPPTLWERIVSEAARQQVDPLRVLRILARRATRGDEEAKKVVKADYALQNLAALGQRHRTLRGLVEELLAQRVGTYDTVLEARHDELSDPAEDPGVVALADRLRGALHGRRRVWLPRMGGLELALSGLLLRGGVTSTGYRDDGVPRDDDVVLDRADGGSQGLALGLFKALQLVHAGALPDAFRDFVSVDLETSDRDPASCEIVELGAVRVRDGRVVDEYHQLVRPARPISDGARAVHHISDEEVAGAPSLAEIWPAFRAFCGDDVLVAHNGNRFDFAILRRAAKSLSDAAELVSFDSLPLARVLHQGSCKLGDLASAFGVELAQAHRAHDDARALAQVFVRLQQEKLRRARKTALVHLLDYLGLALALANPAGLSDEGRLLFKLARPFTLGRFSDCLEYYRLERAAPTAFDAPSVDQVIGLLGGPSLLERFRQQKRASQRYPEAMGRLGRLLDSAAGETLQAQLGAFLDRLALSTSKSNEADPELRHRVNLLTLHATKGLEFSRVYIIGAEDAQLLSAGPEGRSPPEPEVQEARRLLYVGMTRARDRLVLTRAERRGGQPTGGHRFLSEMELEPRSP